MKSTFCFLSRCVYFPIISIKSGNRSIASFAGWPEFFILLLVDKACAAEFHLQIGTGESLKLSESSR